MNMKRFSILIITLLSVFLYEICAIDVFNDFESVAEICAKEQNTTASEIIKYKKEYFHPDVVEENIQCAMLCVFNNYDAMDENAVFNATALKALAPEDKRESVEKVIDKCSDIKGSSPCETAHFIMGCLMKEPTD